MYVHFFSENFTACFFISVEQLFDELNVVTQPMLWYVVAVWWDLVESCYELFDV